MDEIPKDMEELDDTDPSTDLSDRVSDEAVATLDLKSCSAQTLAEDTNIQVLDAADIVGFMNEMIEEVSEIIEEDKTLTRILLTFFKWDKQNLLERFYGRDKRRLFEEANITNLTMRSNSSGSVASENEFTDALQQLPSPGEPASTNQVQELTAEKKQHVTLECGICMAPNETAVEQTLGLICGHQFCEECWTSYLTHRVLKEGMAQNISCPAYGCEVLVNDDMVLNFISDDSTKRKYFQLIANSFVSCNKNLKWCPAPNCGKAIKAETIAKHVTCLCGKKFCFQCGDDWHQPVKCNWIKCWRAKISLDGSTVSWIAAHTKECPRCNATIEKDGGCNHMICRKDNCLYEFCWVCMGPWQEHGNNAWYNCNRFNESSSKNARTAMDRSRSSMLRFLHYYNRYSNHNRSMKLEEDIYTKVNAKIDEIKASQGQAATEVEFLNLAVDMLCKARRTLMNTYVFAYFVVQNNQSIIFEDNQRDLELATEQLSEYLERDIYKSGPEELKQKVNDRSVYLRKRCSVLISHIQEGYDNNWWELGQH